MNVIFFLPCPFCWSDSVPFTVPETDQVHFYFIAPPQDLSSALLPHLLPSSKGSTSSLPSALCFKCLLDQRGLPSLINLNKITATLPPPPIHTHTTFVCLLYSVRDLIISYHILHLFDCISFPSGLRNSMRSESLSLVNCYIS